MAHVRDQWTRPNPATGKRVRTDRYGHGKRWLATWVEPGRQRKSKAFDTKDEANAHIQDVGVAQRTGTYAIASRGRMTFGEYARERMDARTDIMDSTRDRNESILKNHIIPRWGQIALADITEPDVQSWAAGLSGVGPGRERIVSVLASLLNAAVGENRIVVNPAAGIEITDDRPPSEIQVLTPAELFRLANAAEWYHDFILLLGLGAPRIGEACELRAMDLDLKRTHRIRISRSVSDAKGKLKVGPTKTKKARSVAYPQLLGQILAKRAEHCAPTDLLFTTVQGKQIRSRNFGRRAFARAAVTIGRPDLTPHDLRHTAASLAISAGASVKSLQYMLGHASATMTLDRYGHLFDQDLDAVAHAVDLMLKGS